MLVVILGYQDDAHVQHVQQHLTRLGRQVLVLDTRHFPQQVGISFEPAAHIGTIRFPSGRCLPWSDITSIYWRNYAGVAPAPLADPDQAYLAENDSRSLLETFLLKARVKWVNGFDAFRLHQTKPVCLARAAALGAAVPSTTLTNDPAEVAAFVRRHQRVIFKPVQGGDQTRPLTPRHLSAENLSHLRFAPITLQEEVPGTNIRVFVAGERVLACEVATTELDYREDRHARLTIHALPADIESLSIRIARDLALLWTGIDFRLTPGGQYVFLEANPSPMFLGFEAQTGLPLTEALGELLVGES